MTKKVEETTIDYAIVNVELYKQLNKRNQQYIYDLDKALQAGNVANVKRNQLKHEMMTELVEAQKQGKTARQLYGTVSQQVANILTGPKEDFSKPSPDWQLFIDGALMIGSIFTMVAGFSTSYQFGIVSLFINLIFAGFAVLIITKASPKYLGVTNVTNKKFLVRYVLATLLGMAVWMLGMMVMPVVPEAINPILDKTAYVVIGIALLGLRFFLKHKLMIRGTIF